jgi:hypothetical protein
VGSRGASIDGRWLREDEDAGCGMADRDLRVKFFIVVFPVGNAREYLFHSYIQGLSATHARVVFPFLGLFSKDPTTRAYSEFRR